MKIYEIKGPCPELGMTLARLVAELGEGEEAKLVSRWRYVLSDLKSVAGDMGIEIVSVEERGDLVEVLVRRRGQGRRP
ncbi:sulfurtransferase TusA family protein [Pyrobaculum ferrireducens]|uniref:sulfurtransferase TusA family protein n=1 Tax=Pyrobaculum ferrireducens TaxID=1104324 RepID=UPI000AE8C3E5|nr:sulfurtransferase TusA family protein [Pyrobaculum ferrireducens]